MDVLVVPCDKYEVVVRTRRVAKRLQTTGLIWFFEFCGHHYSTMIQLSGQAKQIVFASFSLHYGEGLSVDSVSGAGAKS